VPDLGADGLPLDPAARDAALAEVAPTVELLVAIGRALAARLPPREPLTDEEVAAVRPPLAVVLAKHALRPSPELALAGVLAMIVVPRFLKVRGLALEELAAPKTVGDEPAAVTEARVQAAAA
jgi:hypothetical protein